MGERLSLVRDDPLDCGGGDAVATPRGCVTAGVGPGSEDFGLGGHPHYLF